MPEEGVVDPMADYNIPYTINLVHCTRLQEDDGTKCYVKVDELLSEKCTRRGLREADPMTWLLKT